jgi:uncharacterized protein YjdB
MRHILRQLSLLLLLAESACSSSDSPVAVERSLQVQPTSVILHRGQSFALEVITTGVRRSNVFFHSQSTSIASVDSLGRIMAHAVGETTVLVGTGEAPHLRVEVPVQVRPVVGEADRVQIVLTPHQATLGVDETLRLHATVVMTTDARVHFQSQNPLVVSVDSTGLVRANAPGATEIIARMYADTTVSARVGIQVRSPWSFIRYE